MVQLSGLLGKRDALKVLRRIGRRLKERSRSEPMSQDQFLTLCDEEIEKVLKARAEP